MTIDRFIVSAHCGEPTWGNLCSEPACPSRMDSNDITVLFFFFFTELRQRAWENNEPREIASFVPVNDATGYSSKINSQFTFNCAD